MHPSVGVIGTGAMGIGVIASLKRGGITTHARDIRPEAQRAAGVLGAICHPVRRILHIASDENITLVSENCRSDLERGERREGILHDFACIAQQALAHRRSYFISSHRQSVKPQNRLVRHCKPPHRRITREIEGVPVLTLLCTGVNFRPRVRHPETSP